MSDVVSIIIPTLNEEKNLPIVLKDIENTMKELGKEYEIIIVDGHSKDDTVNIAKQFNTKILYDNIGKGSALQVGMREVQGDIIIMMDADCSHRTSELRLMIEAINSGYDICMGSRFIQGGGTDDMSFHRRVGNKFFVSLVNMFWHMDYSDLCYGYRAFNKKAKDILLPILESNGFGIETEISIKAAKQKLKVLEIPSYEKKRLHGKGKLRSFKDGANILKRIKKELF